jgi:hypothetical protein
MPKPPKVVQNNAKKGLELRRNSPDSKKGGTAIGVARARDLSNGKDISIDTLKRISQFRRHQKNYRPDIKVEGIDGKQIGTKGTQAYLLWGGEQGIDWADRELEKYNNKKKK